MADSNIRLLFIIDSLDAGGAQRQLIELCRALAPTLEIAVCVFRDGGDLLAELQAIANVRHFSLGKRSRWDVLAFARLRSVVAQFRPDIVHGYMQVPNDISLVAARLCSAKVVWGIRASVGAFNPHDRVSRAAFELGRRLARFVDLVICNSTAALEYHASLGYPRERMIVIPNGIDTDRFCPDAEAGRRARATWGVSAEEQVIGLVARLDPMKDHPTFLRAAALLSKDHPSVRFIAVGGGAPAYEREVHSLCTALGLDGRIVWCGSMSDTKDAYRAFDVCTLTSYTEGFPNVLGEAMACGVPCVATDVGDARLILGDLGTVVPPRDPAALASAWAEMLARSRTSDPGRAAALRTRILERFSRDALGARTAAALRDVAIATR